MYLTIGLAAQAVRLMRSSQALSADMGSAPVLAAWRRAKVRTRQPLADKVAAQRPRVLDRPIGVTERHGFGKAEQTCGLARLGFPPCCDRLPC